MKISPARLVLFVGSVVLLFASGCSEDPAAARDGSGTVLGSDASDVLFPDLLGTSDGHSADADLNEGTGSGADMSVEEDVATVEDTSTPVELERGDECAAGDICRSPLVCLGTCQRPCDAGCGEDETCVQLGVGDFGICGAEAGENEPCDPATGTVCSTGLTCNEGTCQAPSEGGELESCNGFSERCEDGFECVMSGPGSGVCLPDCDHCGSDEVCVEPQFFGAGACYQDCDESDIGTFQCDVEGFVCRERNGGGEEACLPGDGQSPGTAELGEACDNRDNRCVEGLFCPGIPGGYCTNNCDEDDDCAEGADCQNFFVFQACIFTCAGGSEECPEDMTCREFA
ncbi:MAG: hypothetical protein KC561_02505, partial [Myxococcales bacterium]|nr:hypothetical protein [Myxococcales bacterium]